MSRLSMNLGSVVDLIIESLQSSGLYAGDVASEIVRTTPAVQDETQIAARAGTIPYGSVGGATDRLTSATDCYVLLDNDATAGAHTNYFEIIKSQGGPPATAAAPYNELATFGSETNGAAEPVMYLTLGPRTSLLTGAAANYPAQINLGASKAMLAAYYATIGTGPAAIVGSTFPSIAGLSIKSSIGATEITHANSGTPMYLHSGQFYYEKSLAFSQIHDDAFQFKSNWTGATTDPTIFFNGSRPGDYRCKVAIGGNHGVAWYDPANVPIGGKYAGILGSASTPHTVSLLVVTPDIASPSQHAGLRVWNRSSAPPDNTHLANIYSSIDFVTFGAAHPKVKLFSVTMVNGTDPDIAFEVRADKRCYGAVFTSAGVDIAENFSVAAGQQYEPGTVMVQLDDGTVVPSAQYADARVVGVVSTNPGYILGDAVSRDEPDVTPVAMAGTVPVNCTNAMGPIKTGNLLVSGANGTACLGYREGCVIGKALEPLVGSFGKVKMLVLNR